MPNSSVAITPGAGAAIAVNAVGGLDFQVVKLDLGADGVSLPAVADSSGFLKVNIAAAAGVVVVNNPTAANLKVDASGATVPISAASNVPVSAVVGGPVFVRISNGSAAVDTLPVSGTVAVTQSTQGAAAVAWPVKISDGTNFAPLDSSNGNALKVSVVASVAPGAADDGSTFTEGTSPVTPISGEYQTSPASPTSGQTAAVRITQKRALMVNLQTAAGAEVGTSGAPLRIDPTGSTTQPVSGTVAVTITSTTLAGTPAVLVNYDTGGTHNLPMVGIGIPASGGAVAGGTATNPIRVDPTGTTTQPVNHTKINGNAVATTANGVQMNSLADSAGTAISAAAGAVNPLPVCPYPSASTFWSSHVAFTASQSAQAIRTPTSGKQSFVQGLIITQIASGTVEVYDGTAGATADLYNGTMPAATVVHIPFNPPRPLSAVNNLLRYTTGSGATGDIVAWGFEQ